jgi:hypothetical protein
MIFSISQQKTTNDTNRIIGGYSLKTNPNFNTNAPPLEVRGCKVILRGAFLGQWGAKVQKLFKSLVF